MGVVIHIDIRQLDITNFHEKNYIDLCSRAKESEEVCACRCDKTVLIIKKLANCLAYTDTGHSSMSFIKLTKMYMDKYQSKIRVHVSISDIEYNSWSVGL